MLIPVGLRAIAKQGIHIAAAVSTIRIPILPFTFGITPGTILPIVGNFQNDLGKNVPTLPVLLYR
ncbi:hypothetical protein [Leclercia sp. W17]|uniref:hypothetical protein n=1 Tax=Leclercia sp. W17 TaxID=2282309 RepID=UPI00143D1C79|nr:hypothetical protein [Leclercia sp. W17]